MERVDAELSALADAYGVATRYEDADRNEVVVADDVVMAVLAQFGVDTSSPASTTRELAAVRHRKGSGALPPTVVVKAGETYPLPGSATLHLEDGTERDVDTEVPSDLPLGWHRLVTADQDVTLCVVPQRLPEVPAAWGWMTQLYSLRSADSWGMGDFADLAEFACRSAAEFGVGVLLVNPVQAIGLTQPVQRSPYSPVSRRFVNPFYLSVTATDTFRQADATIQAKVLALRPDDTADLVDYDAALTAKLTALELLWPHRVEPGEPASDFAVYSALAERHGADWRTWPAPLRDPESADVAGARAELADRVAFHGWLQQLCRAQLAVVRQRVRDAGMAVGVVHDLPVGVHPGGADTWAGRDVFAAEVRVGAPPDAFSQQGQDWRLPPWRPDRLAELGYAPFRDVLRGVLSHADGIRIDHVAGLWRLWWIPPGYPPSKGTYVHYDADAMLGVLTLEAYRANAIVVGEDLGTVEPVVTRTLHERGMLSSAVLWFQRDYDTPGHPFVAPAKWTANAMASISTHDLPTAAGWLTAEHVRLRAELGLLTRPAAEEYADAEADRDALLALLPPSDDTSDKEISLHTLLAHAASRLVLTSPLDALGELRQPNLPGTIDEYPNWRIRMPGTIDGFFADPHVRAVVAPLTAARPPADRRSGPND
ncbi:MAG TPA: 4-alpha-glucanotransferase [Pseudonocardiaceae bacterium]|jgi:4-alpha-glucanotransferase|nr:4-alpha-glucanotransferase [Pseudonocardiaceae bacterium]